MARIEASGEASRALHAACGFELVGIEKEVGRKFNRWLDVALMQKLLP
jgi:phosphinothricin acetyltransferase